MSPDPALGVTEAAGGALDGTTGTLTSAGLTAFPQLKGPVPFDTGSYGYGATVSSGAPYTPFLTNSAGNTMAGVYQHPGTDPQAGVSELALNFDCNASQTQWRLLAPGLINWVTNNTHLGLYRTTSARTSTTSSSPTTSGARSSGARPRPPARPTTTARPLTRA